MRAGREEETVAAPRAAHALVDGVLVDGALVDGALVDAALADGKAARDARLAAALRENLKRRKAADRPVGEHGGGTAQDHGLPQGPNAPETPADRTTRRGTDGAAEGAADRNRRG